MIADILEEHLDAASALSERLGTTRASDAGASSEYQALRARLRAHLDALLDGKELGWELTKGSIPVGRPGDAYVLTRLANESRLLERQTLVGEILRSASPAVAKAIDAAMIDSGSL